MRKIIYLILFSIIVFLILVNSYSIIENIRFSFSLCINNLFPSLTPFMLLSSILINYNFINDLSDIFSFFMTKVFKVSKNASFVFIMSILSGCPSNGKYLKDLLDNNLISIKDTQKCLNSFHFTNPIFILGTIGYNFLNNKKLGLIILLSHYLSSIIIGCFGKKDLLYTDNNTKLKRSTNFINILKESIKSTIDTLLLILGIVTTCIIITSIIDNIISLSNNIKFIYGFIEITQGLKYLSLSNYSIEIKAILSSFIISFGGFCIHAQVFSIIDNKKIRYLPYLISRIIHSILASILTLVSIKIIV